MEMEVQVYERRNAIVFDGDKMHLILTEPAEAYDPVTETWQRYTYSVPILTFTSEKSDCLEDAMDDFETFRREVLELGTQTWFSSRNTLWVHEDEENGWAQVWTDLVILRGEWVLHEGRLSPAMYN